MTLGLFNKAFSFCKIAKLGFKSADKAGERIFNAWLALCLCPIQDKF
jgi:hypothetical protein